MPVYTWTYDGTVRKHLVEIEHIPSSGRLRLHLDGRELHDEIGIRERDWRYLFYIDDELVVAEVKFTNGRYAYDFREEESHESSRIRKARWKERRTIIRYMVIAVTAVLLIAIVPYYIFNKTEWYRHIKLNRGDGVDTWAVYYWNELLRDRPVLTYVYAYSGKEYHGTLDSAVTETFRTPDGMPVWNGDEFRVRLLPDHPRSSAPDFSQPHARTVRRYVDHVAARMEQDTTRLNFVNHDRTWYVHCVLDYVLSHYGIKGLAHIYFRDESQHSDGYREIILSRGYANAARECYELSSDTTLSGT